MRRPSNLMQTITVPQSAPAPVETGSPTDYLDLYGLSKPPFSGGIENANYILFGSQRRAFELLTEHVVNGSGVILLLAEEGVGKTETLHTVAAVAAEAGVQTIVVSRPPDSRISFMQLVSALKGHPAEDKTATNDAIAQFLLPPRKALLVDDIDLMPADCVHLILDLIQRISNDLGAPAIVLSCSNELTSDPQRPELSQLVPLARDTIRLLRLGSAEIRQYIERSLWIAGGTTRRLIAPDAMKVLISRSGGVPGITNRLMTAVLMAGFARGDAMITAKTVGAAMGPAAPRIRHRPYPSEPSGAAGRAMQIVAIGLLILGALAFLYRGLKDQPDRTSTTSPKTSVSASPAAGPLTSDQPPVAKPAVALPADLMAALMKRGDQSLALGDIAAARLLYQRAAEAGNAPAATALGKTYDPNFAVVGSKPDPVRASEWYQKAITLGDARAADLLKKLAPR